MENKENKYKVKVDDNQDIYWDELIAIYEDAIKLLKDIKEETYKLVISMENDSKEYLSKSKELEKIINEVKNEIYPGIEKMVDEYEVELKQLRATHSELKEDENGDVEIKGKKYKIGEFLKGKVNIDNNKHVIVFLNTNTAYMSFVSRLVHFLEASKEILATKYQAIIEIIKEIKEKEKKDGE